MPDLGGWPYVAIAVVAISACQPEEPEEETPGPNSPRLTHVDDRAVVPLDEVERVSVSNQESCAVRRDGSVWCWTYSRERFLDFTQEDGLARRVAALEGSVELAMGDGEGCAVTKAGTVRCWGSLHGDEKRFLEKSLEPPRVIDGIDDVIEVATGDGMACARRRDRSLWCWGFQDLKVGDAVYVDVPTKRLDDVESFALAERSLCALLGSGKLRCLGPVASEKSTLAAEFDPLTRTARPTALSGNGTTFCVAAGGKVGCTGQNQRRPVPVDGFGAVKSFARVPSPSLILRKDYGPPPSGPLCAVGEASEVLCAGDNTQGELGNGSYQSSERAVRVVGIDRARVVAVALHEACAVTEAGALLCWGKGRFVPQPVMRLVDP